MSEEFVTIANFSRREDAFISRGKLQSEGIISFIQENYAIRGATTNNLMVKKSDAPAAQKILDAALPKCPACRSQKIGESLTAAERFLAWVPFAVLLPAFKKKKQWECRACGYKWMPNDNTK